MCKTVCGERQELKLEDDEVCNTRWSGGRRYLRTTKERDGQRRREVCELEGSTGERVSS